MENESVQLTIFKTPTGELETNVSVLESFVKEKLKNYDPSQYTGDVQSAKKARAELNKSSDYVKDGRKQLEDEMRKPFADVLDRLKKIESDIKTASSNIDIIVKNKEQEEKDQKRKEISAYWDKTGFNLFPIDRVFSQQWLNKSEKWTDITKEIDTAQKKVYSDLQIIEQLPDDVATLKVLYLDTLDISSTLQRANQLKENRARIKREEEERKQRELNEQQKEIVKDMRIIEKEKPIEKLADFALADKKEPEVDTDPIMSYTLSFTAPRSVLMELRQYMTNHGIKYTKVEK